MTEPRPRPFVIERPGDVDLAFDGFCLVDNSSRQGRSQTHWTEIRIFRTTTGKYVTEVIGKTTVAGQNDRIRVNIVDSPGEVKDALRRRSGQAFEHDPSKAGEPYLTDFAVAALNDAARNDPALAATLIERI